MLAYVLALFVVQGLQASENIDWDLPDRAFRRVAANDKLLISSIDPSSDPAAAGFRHNAHAVAARQDVLLLQKETDLRSALTPRR